MKDALPRVPARRVAVVVAGSAVLAVGVVALIGKAAGYAKLVDRLDGAKGSWFALCLAGEVVAYAAYVTALRETLRAAGGPWLRWTLATRVSFASLGATRLSPGGVGGLAVLWWALRRAGAGAARAVVLVLAVQTVVFGVFGVGAALAAAALAAGVGGSAPRPMEVAWIATVAFCVLAASWVTSPRRARRLTSTEAPSWRRPFAFAVGGTVVVRQAIGRRSGLYAVGGALAYWAGDAAALWAGLRAFDGRLSLLELVLAYATGYAATILPLPLAGAGGVDAAMTYAVHALGVPLDAALLGVFAYRLFSFWLPAAPGIVALAFLRRTEGALARSPSPAVPAR